MTKLWWALLASVALFGCATSAPWTPTALVPSLTLTAQVAEWCGSIGGCRYSAQLDGPGGLRRFDFAVSGAKEEVVSAGPPLPLSAGTYQLTYVLQIVSDVVENGVVELGPTLNCGGDLDITANQAISAFGVFHADRCAIYISDSADQSQQ